MAAQGVRAQPERRGARADPVPGRPRQADRGIQETPGGTEGTPRRRQQVDRHRWHQPVRFRRLQPRRHSHRRCRQAPGPRGEGLGPARVQEPRRPGRTGYAQHQGRPAPPAQVRPPGRRGRAGHRRHHRPHRPRCRPAQHPDAPRAAQRGEAADPVRHRRLDGRPREGLRGTVLGLQDRVQAPGIFLFPQLHLRIGVEEQFPPHLRAHLDARFAAQVRPGLQGGVRRRRGDGAL